jgi:hypothetical protein
VNRILVRGYIVPPLRRQRFPLWLGTGLFIALRRADAVTFQYAAGFSSVVHGGKSPFIFLVLYAALKRRSSTLLLGP